MHHHGQQAQGPSSQIHCPECGAPAPFRGTAVSLVCEYCGSAVVRTDANVELVGKVSALLDTGSPVLLNSKGTYDGIPFTVEGRLQVSYERGTWNEWFITFADGRVGWLADSQGSFAVTLPMDVSALGGGVPSFHQLGVGMTLNVAGKTGVITDLRGASYQGAEGLLPFRAQPGLVFYGVDLRGYDGEFFTLDYGQQPESNHPIPYVGRAVRLREIKLMPLRQFEGWRR